MSLTLWHRQFRNPIFLVLWTCYSEVQLVTSAAVSLFGGATRCMNICVQDEGIYSVNLFNFKKSIKQPQNCPHLFRNNSATID